MENINALKAKRRALLNERAELAREDKERWEKKNRAKIQALNQDLQQIESLIKVLENKR